MTRQEAIRLATQHAKAVLHPFYFTPEPVHVAFHATVPGDKAEELKSIPTPFWLIYFSFGTDNHGILGPEGIHVIVDDASGKTHNLEMI